VQGRLCEEKLAENRMLIYMKNEKKIRRIWKRKGRTIRKRSERNKEKQGRKEKVEEDEKGKEMWRRNKIE
jgi:hypothetical protein